MGLSAVRVSAFGSPHEDRGKMGAAMYAYDAAVLLPSLSALSLSLSHSPWMFP